MLAYAGAGPPTFSGSYVGQSCIDSNSQIWAWSGSGWGLSLNVLAAVQPVGSKVNVLAPVSADSVGQGSWGVIQSSQAVYGVVNYNPSAANGDNATWDVALAAGTWTLTYVYFKNPGYGITQVFVDGTQVGSNIDGYAASNTSATLSITGITLASSGIHAVKVAVNGKNASSTGYAMAVSGFLFTRTA